MSIMKALEKKKWIAALRSGKYEQGGGALRSVRIDDTSSYCCLGVAACAIRGVEPKADAKLLRNNTFGLSALTQGALARANDGTKGGAVSLATTFGKAGFGNSPVLDSKSATGMLKSSFTSIANWIEKNL